MYFIRQFLHKICQIQLSFLIFIACKMFLSSCLEAILFISHTISSNDILHPSPPHFQTFKIFLIYFGSVQFSEPYKAMLQMQHSASSHRKNNSKMDFTEVRPALWAEFASLRIGDRCYVLEHTLMNLGFLKRGREGGFRIVPLNEFRENNV